jgi:peptidoglycan hydrolase-like protein with peptidoglycan-binding domain
MPKLTTRIMKGAATSAALLLFAASSVSAQVRAILPQGSVIIVRTQTALESNRLTQGQTFETVVDDTVGVDNYTVIPAGSRIRGVVTLVHPANRQQSGVIEVDFDRLTLADGTTYTIRGKLTSTDAAERRQIDSSANQRVVLVGGRGGIGAAIAGAGSQNRSTSSLLGALGALLSEGTDVSVPAGTQLAVQLEQSVSLRRRGGIRQPDQTTIYTSTDLIRAAQRALAQQNYYRGTIDGTMSYATQRALFEYQSDKRLNATGNLDWQTAQSLGLSLNGGTLPGNSTGSVLSPATAASLRRNAQALVGRQRQEISISSMGRVNTNRVYAEGDINLWFALSAFADNASLYEQIVSNGVNSDAAVIAGRALVDAARRVDTAFQIARPSTALRNSWMSIRSQLATIDATYQ